MFFKTQKPKQFEYEPRYYDPQKEAIEQRRREMGLSDQQTHQEQLRARMRFEWERRKDMRKRKRNNNIRLLVFIALIIILLSFIIY
jgi:cytochrome c-type biogenesis protein CcmH/NrfG